MVVPAGGDVAVRAASFCVAWIPNSGDVIACRDSNAVIRGTCRRALIGHLTSACVAGSHGCSLPSLDRPLLFRSSEVDAVATELQATFHIHTRQRVGHRRRERSSAVSRNRSRLHATGGPEGQWSSGVGRGVRNPTCAPPSLRQYCRWRLGWAVFGVVAGRVRP